MFPLEYQEHLDSLTLFWGLGYSSAGLTGFNRGSRFNPCTPSLRAPAVGPRLLIALLSVSLFSPVLHSAVWSLRLPGVVPVPFSLVVRSGFAFVTGL